MKYLYCKLPTHLNLINKSAKFKNELRTPITYALYKTLLLNEYVIIVDSCNFLDVELFDIINFSPFCNCISTELKL